LIESEIRFDKSKKNKILKFLEQFLTIDEKEYMKNNPDDIKTIIKFASAKIKSNKSGLIMEKQENIHTNIYPLKVVIGLVIWKSKILFVKRRDSELNLMWQFPAGILKKNKLPEVILEREVKAETNVICKVISNIGSRVHPDTQVICQYYLCEYLSGDLFNADSEENEDVQWVNIDNYEKYITSNIYTKVKDVLEKIKKEL
jgi:ADP-ribose pyrophosphatase YjhB (NUDIX family)